MAHPLRMAFLGCGFITGVHSRHMKALRGDIVCSFASRDPAKAEAFCRQL
jgi:predicted dehydrogenase